MEYTKKCTKCGRELPLCRFCRKKLKSGSLGYQIWCIDCKNTASVERYRNNPEKQKAAVAKWQRNNSEKKRADTAEWRRNNSERVKAARARWYRDNSEKEKAATAEWRRNNRERVNEYIKKRKAIDPGFRLIYNIRAAMHKALKHNAKSSYTVELLGCSIEELRVHLEQLFLPGMTWANYGTSGWHIDHIIPLSYFDMSDPEQQKRAWHYTNLRPLWAVDNLRKNNKIEERQLLLM